MSEWLYVTSAKSIQGYIFSSNKLTENIGASEIVETLTGSYLDALIKELNLENGLTKISQAAGIARLVFTDKESADRLYRLWPIAAEQYAPGLELVQALVEVKDSLKEATLAAEKELRSRRNRPETELPVPGPAAVRSRRDGSAAIGYHRDKKDKESHPVSRSQKRKLFMSSKAHNEVVSRVSPETEELLKWTRDIDKLAGGDKNYIAIIHADGNGLGRTVMQLGETLKNKSIDEACSVFRKFSEAVSKATEESVRSALKTAVIDAVTEHNKMTDKHIKHNPVRPLVCAGDDVTLIMSPEYAIDFVKEFLKAFQVNTRQRLNDSLGDMTGSIGVDEGLKACAGIVFAKPHHPFIKAYNLSESLCKYSKDKTNRTRSAVSFWRITGGGSTDFGDEILEDELRCDDGIELTMMPYVVEKESDGYPLFSDLRTLAHTLRYDLPRGATRKVLAACYESKAEAERKFERMREILESNDKTKKSVKNFLKQLNKLTGTSDGKTIFRKNMAAGESRDEAQWVTPLYDALSASLFLKPQKHTGSKGDRL